MPGPLRLEPGAVVELKKGHPCGTNQWEIIRAGMDVKVRCTGCGRYVSLPRPRFERRIKRFLRGGPEDRSSN